MFIYIVYFIVFILIIGSIYYYLYSQSDEIVKSIMPLNEKKDILMPDITQQKILGSSGTTVMAFFKLNLGDRTNTFNDVNNKVYSPLICVENNWYLETIASSTNTDAAQTRLRVANYSEQSLYDYVELPPIPKQKWVFIAILRDGRRFDVIYDNIIVASKRFPTYPTIISSPLSTGSKNLSGSVIHVIVKDSRISPNSVEYERKRHIDTNGVVIETGPIYSAFPTTAIFGICPPGASCDITTSISKLISVNPTTFGNSGRESSILYSPYS
jgi:hypothetical protein